MIVKAILAALAVSYVLLWYMVLRNGLALTNTQKLIKECFGWLGVNIEWK